MNFATSRPRVHRATFHDILEAAQPQAQVRLAARAKLANQIAKIVTDKASRAVAYAVKTAALERGIQLGFRLRGDELGRPGLARVNTGSHGSLHVRLDALSRELLKRPDIRVRLHGSAA